MKKVLAIFVTAAVLLVLAAFPAYADRTPRFYLEGPATVKPGDRFTVDLKIEGDFEAHILNLRVSFDPTSLRYVSSENGEASFGIANSGVTVDGNEFTYGAMSLMDASSKEGVISKITFEVLSTAASRVTLGIEVKEFEKFDLFATNPEAISYTTEDLSISVSGGSGTGPTPIPGPGEHTPGPNLTGDPNYTPEPYTPIDSGEPNKTESAPDRSSDPSRTAGPTDPNATPDATPDPDAAPDPDATPAPTQNGGEKGGEGETGGRPKWVIPVIAIAGGAVVIALAAVIVIKAVISAREKKNNG